MCKAIEDMKKESVEQGIEQTNFNAIKNLMDTLKLTAEQAMEALKIPVEDRTKYFAKL